MATVKSTLALEDKMSQTLTSIDKVALRNIQTFNNMAKEVDNLKKTLAEAERINPNIVKTEQYAQASIALEKMENKLYDVAHGEQSVEQANDNLINSNKGLKLSMTEVNQTLELAKKGWSMLKGIMNMASQWVEAANIQIGAETKLQVVMQQRMNANSDMIDSIKQLTSEQQKLGVVGDEVQLSGAQQLSTFLNSNKALQTLIPAMNNLAVQQNGVNVSSSNMVSIGNMMGKVMQGQTSALTRVGITFTKTEEKMLKYGNEEQRAATLAKVIKNNVGEMNKAFAQTPEGKMKQIDNEMGDLSETLGNSVMPYFISLKEALLKAIAPAIQWVADNMDWLAPVFLAFAAVIAIVIIALTAYAIVNGIVALSEMAMFWPLLLIIGALLLIIGIIYLVVDNINKATGSTISALGVIVGAAYMFFANIYNQVIMPLQNAIAMLVNFIANCFKDPIASVQILFIDMANTVLKVLSSLASALDGIFHTNLKSGVDSLIGKLNSAKNDIKEASGYEEVMELWKQKDPMEAYQKGYDIGAGMDKAIKDFKISGVLEDIGSGLNNFNELTGIDGTGEKALKTTSNDKLLDEEDVQLLLDVATRDYKLNYQQVTPEFIITFGDVKETADVDEVLDEVADRLQEIYDGSLVTT